MTRAEDRQTGRGVEDAEGPAWMYAASLPLPVCSPAAVQIVHHLKTRAQAGMAAHAKDMLSSDDVAPIEALLEAGFLPFRALHWRAW